jgi:Mrp family chromosome partitioning ATPase
MENANAECVGPTSEKAGQASSCEGCPNQGACKSGEPKRQQADPQVQAAQAKIKRRVFVLSGKGGVGKSTFSAQLAFGLARQGFKVGLLDVDICGPSLPLMMGLLGREVHQSASGWSPVYVDVDAEDPSEDCELGVMSIGFLMPDPDAAVIWRGPRKTGLMTQFFGQVDWG